MAPKKQTPQKPLPDLPEGIRIGEKPTGIDFLVRGDGRWFSIVEHLKVLDAQATIQIDVAGCSKQKIQGMKASIKHAAEKLGFHHQIKFAIQGNLLHIWSNK